MSSSQFLSLSPITSASYPSTPFIKSPVQAPLKSAEEQISDDVIKTRRSSSSASSDSSGKLRFLKLGPVHHGKGDELGDWSDVVVAE